MHANVVVCGRVQEERRLKTEADEMAGQFSVSQRESQMPVARFENATDIKVGVSVLSAI